MSDEAVIETTFHRTTEKKPDGLEKHIERLTKERCTTIRVSRNLGGNTVLIITQQHGDSKRYSEIDLTPEEAAHIGQLILNISGIQQQRRAQALDWLVVRVVSDVAGGTSSTAGAIAEYWGAVGGLTAEERAEVEERVERSIRETQVPAS